MSTTSPANEVDSAVEQAETSTSDSDATPVKRAKPSNIQVGEVSGDESKNKKVEITTPNLQSEDVEDLASQEAETEDLDETDNLDYDDEIDEEDDEEEDEVTVLGDDDAESVVTRLISPALEQEREARKTEDRKLLALLAHFDEEQLNRFETFRRATFPKASVRRLIQSIAPCTVSQNVVIAVAGMTKVYIGKLVEEALDYKERLGESGPLLPKHIREAFRVLNEDCNSYVGLKENPLK